MFTPDIEKYSSCAEQLEKEIEGSDADVSAWDGGRRNATKVGELDLPVFEVQRADEALHADDALHAGYSQSLSALQWRVKALKKQAYDPKAVDARPCPPILYIKTHKTGSSTMANIIHRMIERRNLTVMFPSDGALLGYPFDFPGRAQISLYGQPDHQFDVICNHAVYNPLMYSYLKPHPFVVTSLRLPTELIISAKSFFVCFKDMEWEEFLNTLESLEAGSQPEALKWPLTFRFKNMQAFDLGWYDFVGNRTDFDSNDIKISEWREYLDKDIESVILAEYFDEGMALLRQKLPVDIEELTYIRMKDNKAKVAPTESQLQRVALLSNVDRSLYAHFNRSFWQEWFSSNVSQLELDVAALRHLNQQLELACDEGDPQRCPPSISMDSWLYTKYLMKKVT